MRRVQENDSNAYLYQKLAWSNEKQPSYSKTFGIQTLIENSHSNEVMNLTDQKEISNLEIVHEKLTRDMLEEDSKTFLNLIQTTPSITNKKIESTLFISYQDICQQEPFQSLFTKRQTLPVDLGEKIIPKSTKLKVVSKAAIISQNQPNRKQTVEEDFDDIDLFDEPEIKNIPSKREIPQVEERRQVPEPQNKGFKSGLQVSKESKAKNGIASRDDEDEGYTPRSNYTVSNQSSRFDPSVSVVTHMAQATEKSKPTDNKRKFKIPFAKKEGEEEKTEKAPKKLKIGEKETKNIADFFDGEVPDEFKNLDVRMVENIHNEILCKDTNISWDDIAGLEGAKSAVFESVIWPMLNPQLFTGIRSPPKGILLFGPPGTGKTLIGKAIAMESKATFFNISASSLMSKWIGEGEKLVRTLFAVAKFKQPSVIFIDEIDSLLSKRSEGDSDNGTRRMKTEFLVHLDGASTTGEDRILIVGATNLPQEIDEAVRRRLSKRLYIPLPNGIARGIMIKKLLKEYSQDLSDRDLEEIVERTEGYSGADMKSLCTDVSLNPLRDVKDIKILEKMDAKNVRPIVMKDFEKSLKTVKPSVSEKDIKQHEEWNEKFGTFGQ